MDETASMRVPAKAPDEPDPLRGPRGGSLLEIFVVFLRLGVTSFGGPIAHIGYFREELVVRRKWIGEAAYADLVALCQFLPGPASSQVGFSLGVLRGQRLLGGLLAWTAFTFPSALILFGFAGASAALTGPVAVGLLHGLKLVAVAVVAQAVWGMTRTLTPDRERVAIAFFAIVTGVLLPAFAAQPAAIAIGALAGIFFCRDKGVPEHARLDFPVRRSASTVALIIFAALLFVPAIPKSMSPVFALFAPFYRAGAMVFGGGHVVLPLLDAAVVTPGLVTNETFLTGYGLAQAVPGPLFTFAAYLGAVIVPQPFDAAGAAVALIAIFLPGLLLVYGMFPFWDRLRG